MNTTLQQNGKNTCMGRMTPPVDQGWLHSRGQDSAGDAQTGALRKRVPKRCPPRPSLSSAKRLAMPAVGPRPRQRHHWHEATLQLGCFLIVVSTRRKLMNPRCGRLERRVLFLEERCSRPSCSARRQKLAESKPKNAEGWRPRACSYPAARFLRPIL